jgi:dihydroorotase-like cyclic amidohydrolase
VAEGSDADLILLDPENPTVVRHEDQLSKAQYTTIDGRTVNWTIDRVLLRGQTIYHDGKFPFAPLGQFVRA